MSITGESLYDLLPAAFRTADDAGGGTVRALLEVLAAQFDALDADLEQMGEDWFIETCSPWVVPYIGELVGEHLIAEIEGVATPRARIANTIGYRRRKGTVAVLEALTRDTTGWPARAVEYYRLLAADQHLADIRLERPAHVSLRDANALELVDTPFDTAPHTVDVRRIEGATKTGRSRHNIPNVGLHVYRLGAYWVPRATAAPATSPSDGRYHVDPLQRDVHLFNRPAPETEIDHLATEVDVAARLRRRPLHDELEARRADLAAGRTPQANWFGDRPAVRVYRALNAGDPVLEVPPEQIDVCHLGDLGGPPGWRRPPAGRISVDPVLGRLAFPDGELPAAVLVSSAYGFAGEVGAGPYDRSAAVAALIDRKVTWQVGVSRDVAAVPDLIFPTLGEAVEKWNEQPDGTVGLIAVMDSHRFEEDLTGANRLIVGEGSLIAIVAAGWPELPIAGGLPGQLGRQVGRISATGVRPALVGDLEIRGAAPDDSPALGAAIVDGLLVSGRVNVTATTTKDLGRLTVAHSTIEGGVRVTGQNEHLTVVIERSIVGQVRLSSTVPVLMVADSIVDARGTEPAIQADSAAADLDGVTVLGRTRVRQVEATNCIFTGALVADRTQVGCVRYSSLGGGSVTPRRYRCQPDAALAAHPHSDPTAIAARTAPSFTSEDPGDPGYAQLGRRCPPEIAYGADGGFEMGAFGFLRSPQRAANLLASLDEYLRLGLDAALIPET
jgi:hypothetical protein